MKTSSHSGFTLIELILVAVTAGLIAVVALPSVMKARDAAESAAAVGHLRAIHTNQTLYKSQGGRYARLSELNAYANGTFGRVVGTTLRHKDFVFMMFPYPTNESLRTDFNIIAYRIREGRILSHYQMSENGSIVTVLP